MLESEERLLQLVKENKEYNEINHIDDNYVPFYENFAYQHFKDIENLLIKNKQLIEEYNKLKNAYDVLLNYNIELEEQNLILQKKNI